MQYSWARRGIFCGSRHGETGPLQRGAAWHESWSPAYVKCCGETRGRDVLFPHALGAPPSLLTACAKFTYGSRGKWTPSVRLIFPKILQSLSRSWAHTTNFTLSTGCTPFSIATPCHNKVTWPSYIIKIHERECQVIDESHGVKNYCYHLIVSALTNFSTSWYWVCSISWALALSLPPSHSLRQGKDGSTEKEKAREKGGRKREKNDK